MTLNENAAAHQFQVDLRGVIDLLSRHIYSGPRVYLRELLQNAVDAISARRGVDGRGGGCGSRRSARHPTSSSCATTAWA
jgi:molecular chaperone HtpG